MTASDFIFDSVQLYYKCHKTNVRRGGLYFDYPDEVKNKEAIMNLENKDGKCFQYTTTVEKNHGKIESLQKEFQIIKHL